MPANYLPRAANQDAPRPGVADGPPHAIFVSAGLEAIDSADQAGGSYRQMATFWAMRLLAATPIDWQMESRVFRSLADTSCSVGYTFALRPNVDALPLALFGGFAIERDTSAPPELVRSSIHDRRLVSVSTGMGPASFIHVEEAFED